MTSSEVTEPSVPATEESASITQYERTPRIATRAGSGPGEHAWLESLDTDTPGVDLYRLRTADDCIPGPLRLHWSYASRHVVGTWTSGALHTKRLRADWEPPDVESSTSIESPVVCSFGMDEANVLTFALSNAQRVAALAARLREEDALVHATVDLFTEDQVGEALSELYLRIDRRCDVTFGESLQEVARWWHSDLALTPMHVPPMAAEPVYSTWYAYHQNVETKALLEECRLARELGCRVVILDDGWQTQDSNRGYDFTGDWEPLRMTDVVDFVRGVHELGMQAMLWFSVPFCGVRSEAFARFSDRLLTKEHRWAPVLDPRFPEVRAYLLDKYRRAVEEWGFDGLKLDFIDEFKRYPATPDAQPGDGRDHHSVTAATQTLLAEVHDGLQALKPDLLTEFRQRYSGPLVRRYGNMIRAFDCPADAITNRVRVTDLRLLSQATRIHSDMLMWHESCTAEEAARQLLGVMHSVPQVSIRLAEAEERTLAMLKHYLAFAREHQALLLDGTVHAHAPLANYPLLELEAAGQTVALVYEDWIVPLRATTRELKLINATAGDRVLPR